jgi:hypothetical protein
MHGNDNDADTENPEAGYQLRGFAFSFFSDDLRLDYSAASGGS